MAAQVCPFHADEWIAGVALGDDLGTVDYLCDRSTGHPVPGPWEWPAVPDPLDIKDLTGLATTLKLEVALPAAVKSLGKVWSEYGLVERAYATRKPKDFARLVERFGHIASGATGGYTASAFLAGTLGRLTRAGRVAYRPGEGTGRWAYNQPSSYWAALPSPPWEKRVSWAEAAHDMSYVEGSTE